jgi:hypothetical protein
MVQLQGLPCFANVASAIFTGNAIDALCHGLRISFRPGFHERTPKRVCLVLKIVFMLYRFAMHLNFSETPLKYRIYR